MTQLAQALTRDRKDFTIPPLSQSSQHRGVFLHWRYPSTILDRHCLEPSPWLIHFELMSIWLNLDLLNYAYCRLQAHRGFSLIQPPRELLAQEVYMGVRPLNTRFIYIHLHKPVAKVMMWRINWKLQLPRWDIGLKLGAQLTSESSIVTSAMIVWSACQQTLASDIEGLINKH